jgi:hypothetical protein
MRYYEIKPKDGRVFSAERFFASRGTAGRCMNYRGKRFDPSTVSFRPADFGPPINFRRDREQEIVELKVKSACAA